MRVFVTGGTGFVGCHICEELTAHGHEVTVLTRSRSDQLPGVSYVTGDIRSFDLNLLKGFEGCIHNALVWGDESGEAALWDVVASARLLQSAAQEGVSRIIYTSSTAVHRPFGGLMDESRHLTPVDLYGATKAANEALASTVGACVIRPGPCVGPPAGPRGEINSSPLFRQILQRAVAKMPLEIDSPARQFTPVRDLAVLYRQLLESDRERETYIAVAKEKTPWGWVADEAARQLGLDSRSLAAECPDEGGTFDVGKLERDFGLVWSAEQAISDMLKALIAEGSEPMATDQARPS